MNVNSYMNLIYLKCQSVIFFLNLDNVVIKTVLFYILILMKKLKIVHGMIEDSVDTDPIVKIDMLEEYYVSTIYVDFVSKELDVNLCIHDLNFLHQILLRSREK